MVKKSGARPGNAGIAQRSRMRGARTSPTMKRLIDFCKAGRSNCRGRSEHACDGRNSRDSHAPASKALGTAKKAGALEGQGFTKRFVLRNSAFRPAPMPFFHAADLRCLCARQGHRSWVKGRWPCGRARRGGSLTRRKRKAAIAMMLRCSLGAVRRGGGDRRNISRREISIFGYSTAGDRDRARLGAGPQARPSIRSGCRKPAAWARLLADPALVTDEIHAAIMAKISSVSPVKTRGHAFCACSMKGVLLTEMGQNCSNISPLRADHEAPGRDCADDCRTSAGDVAFPRRPAS